MNRSLPRCGRTAAPALFAVGLVLVRAASAEDNPPSAPAEPTLPSPEPAPSPSEPLPSAPEPAPPPTAALPPAPAPPASTPASPARSEPLPAAAPPPPAAVAPTSEPKEEQPKTEKPKEEDNSNGIFGPFRIGAVVGAGLPNLVSFGGMIRLTRFFAAGLNIGLIPTLKIGYYGEATLMYQEYDLYGHIYPWGGALFLGAGVGYETVKGTLSKTFDLRPYQQPGLPIPDSLDLTSRGSVHTLVLTPQIGLFHTFGSGFSLGADIGAQVPIAPSRISFATEVAFPAGVPQAVKDQVVAQLVTPNDRKVHDTLETIGRTVLPTFNVRIGWLF